MHLGRSLLNCSAATATLFAIGSVAAQVAPSPAAPSVPAANEVPVELSPFVVDSSRDVGYMANNTLAGSRFNTALKDTPASISVMTQEFLSDLGAYDLKDALAYAVNVEFSSDDDRLAQNGQATIQNYQTYRVRGINASVSQNYFASNGPTPPAETAFIERIEDSRGPNSVLFGIASPGGVINVMTKQAQGGRAFRAVSFGLGSYDSKRATLDVNQPALNGKLAVRLNLVYNKDNGFRHWTFQEHKRLLLAAKYDLTDKTRIRVDFERGQLADNTPRSFNLDNSFLGWHYRGRPTFATLPAADVRTANAISQQATAAAQARVTYVSNNDMAMAMRGTMLTTSAIPTGPLPADALIGSGIITDTKIADYSINVGGPAQTRFNRYGKFTAFVTHQFAKNTFLELCYNHVESSFDNRDPRQDSPNSLKGDPNQLLNNGAANPFAGRVYLETNWFRTVRWDQGDTGRATFSTGLDAKKWGNYRVALLSEYENSAITNNTYREFWVDSATGLPAFNPAPENAQNNVWRRTYPTERDWASYYISGPVGSGGLIKNATDPVTGRTLSSAWLRQGNPSETHNKKKSYMLALQARYFNERLIVAGGMRRDDLDEFNLARWRNPATGLLSIARNPADAAPGQEATSNNNAGRTKTLGLVYHATRKLSVFYNQSDNISLPGRGDLTLPPSGEPGNPIPPPPPRGRGQDIGIGLDLLEGRIYAKATYYTTKSTNQSITSPAKMHDSNTRIMDALLANGLVSQTEYDVRTNVGNVGLFDNSSTGVELQITANPTTRWRVQANYARTNAIEDNRFNEWKNWDKVMVQYLSQFNQSLLVGNGNTIAQEVAAYQDELRVQTASNGIAKLGNRRDKVSLVTRYGFSSGWLKGAYVGGTYRFQSKMYTGVDTSGNKVYSNSFWRSDFLAGYAMRGWRRDQKLNFQLNVFNIFNEHDPLITRYAADGRVSREVVQPPTTWRLATNLEF